MMKHLIKATLGLLFMGFTGLSAIAEVQPVLRSQVMTLSDIVTVGDFYSDAGAHAAKPLFRSPDMGTSGNVPANLVAERARAAGLTTAGTDGLRTVVVHRGATELGRDQLANLVRKTLGRTERRHRPEQSGCEAHSGTQPRSRRPESCGTDPVRPR